MRMPSQARLSQVRLPLAWFALSAITLISWWLGQNQSHAFAPDAAVSVSVILMAAVKVRVIFREFMDVGHAPVLLNRLTDGWLALMIAGLLAAYFLTGRV